MSEDHYKKSICRLCDSSHLILAAPIPATPVGDAYISSDALSQVQECYPLDIYQCMDCGHFQLLDVVSPDILFSEYSYFSGRSPGLVRHFEEYAANVLMKYTIVPHSLVIDIGSNDGSFLQYFQKSGMRVLGVDPAKNVAAVANAAGIPTLTVMFDKTTVEHIHQNYGPAAIITANNVFAHTDDLQGMARNICSLLQDDGLFFFEVSYFPDVIDKLLLGTIFHEHLSYHTIKPLSAFLERCGLQLINVERVSIQGGSIICTAQKKGRKYSRSAVIDQLIAVEEERGLYGKGSLLTFSQNLFNLKNEVQKLLYTLQGKSLAAFGASRGGTLLLYLLDLGQKINFIVDDDPQKQGKYSPGFHIPVFPTPSLYEKNPEFMFILAWVHSQKIIQQHRRYLSNGGKFITFFPILNVVGIENIND